jgi:DnaK suppressor protein
MNERQREYFRDKLLLWKDEILKEAKETLQHLQDENQNHPDLADRASSETDRAIELRARDRQRKLIAKIDAALQRLEDGTYGYCEETGEPISLRRLEARPIATLSIEAQERHERREPLYRDAFHILDSQRAAACAFGGGARPAGHRNGAGSDAGLAAAAGQGHRAVRGRRQYRCGGAPDLPADERGFRAAIRGREPGRRQRNHRG